MVRAVAPLLALALALPPAAAPRLHRDDRGVAAYDVSWNTSSPEDTRTGPTGNYACRDSTTYADAMPLGNGNLVALAWANASAGGVSCYVRKADAMNSGTGPITLALLEITLSPNPFRAGGYFNQTLHLQTATVSVLAGGTGYADHEVALSVRVDANHNLLRVSVVANAGKAYSITARLAPVRPLSPPGAELVQDVDVLLGAGELSGLAPLRDAVVIFHRNTGLEHNKSTNVTSSAVPLVESVLTKQGTPELVPLVTDWWTHSQSGLALRGFSAGAGASPRPLQRSSDAPDALVSAGRSERFELAVHALTMRTATASLW